MLSIAAMAKGQGRYYTELAREDYYTEGGEPPGKWWGEGARHLGLTGHVQKEDLKSLFAGFAPDGEPLIQNAGEGNHQPGWDLTFSAPKSVSVLWSQADESGRQKIQNAHYAAVKEALAYIQQGASFSRRGKGGHTSDPAALVVATFEHGTSRALDPQLHTHSLVMNVSVRPDGTTGTLLSKPFYQHKMAAGALYRVELAHRLTQELQVECQKVKAWFEIDGVSKTLMQEFSKRRASILDELSSRGLETASAAAFAAFSTREAKGVVPPRSQLFKTWQAIGQTFGFTFQSVPSCSSPSLKSKDVLFQEASKKALVAITTHQSFFTEREYLRRTAEASQDGRLSTCDVLHFTKQSIADAKRIVHLGEHGAERQYTTPEVLALEKKVLRQAAILAKGLSQGVSAPTAERVLARYRQERSIIGTEAKHHAKQILRAAKRRKTKAIDRPKLQKDLNKTLNTEQRRAFKHLTKKRGGQLRILDGIAGTEKGLLFRAVAEAYERAGYKVLAVAPSAKLARNFESSSGIKTLSLSGFEFLLKNPLTQSAGHHAKQLLKTIFGLKTVSQFAFDRKTVVIIDEASMIGTRSLERIMTSAKRGRGLLILSGDERSLSPVEAGGAYAHLAKEHGFAFLGRNVRQKHEKDYQNVKDIAEGKATTVLRDLASRGLLNVSKDHDKAQAELIKTWTEKERGRRDKCLIIAGSEAEAFAINKECQKARLAKRELDQHSKVTFGEDSFYKGDRIRFLETNRPLGITNGQTGTIISIDTNRRRITTKIDDDGTAVIPVRDYKKIALAYALCIKMAASQVVQNAYVLLGGEYQDRHASYVQLSRATHQTRLFADEQQAGADLSRLADQMGRSRAKIFAHDIEQLAQSVTR